MIKSRIDCRCPAKKDGSAEADFQDRPRWTLQQGSVQCGRDMLFVISPVWEAARGRHQFLQTIAAMPAEVAAVPVEVVH